jgi:hypothetical protein
MLKDIWCEKPSFQVDIAGYGTSRLHEEMSLGEGFSIHGTVPPDELVDLQSRATAQIVHQTYGLGALTRVPEALVARVPIIANAHAARSAHDLDGVYIYQDATELADLIGEPLPDPPSLDPPEDAERRFIRHIRTMNGFSDSG